MAAAKLCRGGLYSKRAKSPAKKCANVNNFSMMSHMQASSNVDDSTNQSSQNMSNKITSRYGIRDIGPYVVYVYSNSRITLHIPHLSAELKPIFPIFSKLRKLIIEKY